MFALCLLVTGGEVVGLAAGSTIRGAGMTAVNDVLSLLGAQMPFAAWPEVLLVLLLSSRPGYVPGDFRRLLSGVEAVTLPLPQNERPKQPKRSGLPEHLLTNATLADKTAPAPSNFSLQKYTRLKLIDSGGFADVYEGLGSQGQRVAIKQLKRTSEHKAYKEQLFRREVRILSRLRSVAVPRLLGKNLKADPPFYVMEFIEGITLQKYVDSHGHMTERKLLSVASLTAHALLEIHSQKFLHRDIKPANIMVSGSRAVLLDLGIGKDLESLTDSVSAHPGSWPYAAPEYFVSKNNQSPASDVFSWGAAIGFAATGHTPYGARSGVAQWKQAVEGKLDPGFVFALRRYSQRGELGEALSTLLLEATDPDPGKRPSTAALYKRLNRLNDTFASS